MSEKDSLFGTPPPSPQNRGRSPSLALPESSGWRLDDAQTCSQNVGTIALPGSQKHSSELPVFPKPALPSGNSVLILRPPAKRAQAPPLPRQSTSRPAARSASSPATHSARTDRTLRDLVGLISHFEPVTTASPSRATSLPVPYPQAGQSPELHPPGSAQNPIEIDDPGPTDAVTSALVALAGTVANALRLPPVSRQTSSLPGSIVNNVLQFIKHDPKLIPTLKATYDYLGSIPNNLQHSPRSFSHVTTNHPDPPSGRSRRRKTKPSVPAGAGHWDVPFPFAPGKGPTDYPSQWHLQRGRRVLGELLGLFERGFAEARSTTKRTTTCKTLPQPPAKKQRINSVASASGAIFEASTDGVSARGGVPAADITECGLDYQRMTDWLSSVPPLPTSSIMDPTNLIDIPSPSPSDPSPLASDSLRDFMAILGPNVPDAANTGVDSTKPDLDFAGAFDELDAGMGGVDVDWQFLLGSGSASQSINDITAFPMVGQTSSSNDPRIYNVASEPLHSSIQPAVYSSQSVPQSLQATPTCLTMPMECQDLTFRAAPSDPATSPVESTAGPSHQHPCDQPIAVGTRPEIDSVDTQSVGAHSLLTVPTTSGSSSHYGPTPSLYASDSMSPAPSANAGSSTAGQTKVERKEAALAKAREYRDRLMKELERTQLQRWELLIEGGVLRNLEKTGTQ